MHADELKDHQDMNFAMRLSLGVGILLIFVKAAAYYLTNSTAVFSDMAESFIHIFAVGFSVYSMWLSLKPADENHLYGHEKIGFFSAGFEGAMILVAAVYIFYKAIDKMIHGITLDNLNEGVLFTVIAIALNFFLSLYLIRKGKKYQSIILEANGKHILTDCWTSFGVILALLLVKFTKIKLFDPLIAMLTALNIFWTAIKLIQKCIGGLMDKTDSTLHKTITKILQEEIAHYGLSYHHLRHRLSGQKVLIEFHLLFPTNIKLYEAHDIASAIESTLKKGLERKADIFTHLEPEENHDQIHDKYGLNI